jgi:diketogulonate reductase-like aldo/keto reductase
MYSIQKKREKHISINPAIIFFELKDDELKKINATEKEKAI